MAYSINAIMYWHDGTQFQKISDHGRAALTVNYDRIGSDNRMADGTMRRYSIAKKRTWTTSWENLPSVNTKGAQGGLVTVDGGWSGSQMESFYQTNDGAFQMQLRSGDGTLETVTVVLTDFQKEVTKRGPRVDLWNLSVTIVEV